MSHRFPFYLALTLASATGCVAENWRSELQEMPVSAVWQPTEAISTTTEFRLSLPEYLDVDTLRADSFRVYSGGLELSGTLYYDVVEREIRWQPSDPMPVGLSVTIEMTDPPIENVLGESFAVLAAEREVGPGAEERAGTLTATRWAEVNDILERKCRTCHGDAQWRLNPLTYESLVAVRSEQRDRLLVHPGSSAKSYLMHKILEDYPLRRFSVQPPPWSEGIALSRNEIRTLSSWIEDGALP